MNMWNIGIKLHGWCLRVKNNSVFIWPYRKSYYITHPWEWFTQLWWNLKCGYERVMKGYSERDVVEMYSFILNLIPNMLEDMVTGDISAYPGNEEFDKFEKWQDYIMGMAGEFRELREDWCESKNEYAEEFYKKLRETRRETRNGNFVNVEYEEDEEFKELKELYFDRVRELTQQQNEATRKAFADLASNFYALWI